MIPEEADLKENINNGNIELAKIETPTTKESTVLKEIKMTEKENEESSIVVGNNYLHYY